MTDTPLAAWSERLTATAAGRVHVLAETGSTMDAARRLAAAPGDIVVAGRQTAGRGRRGRAWADTGQHGVAMTVAVAAGPAERIAVAMAVGVARAAERLLGRPVRIKWPNDVLVDGRKVCGILIERTDGVDLVGIGFNVNQAAWPAAIAHRAISLRQARGDDATFDRLAVTEAAITEIRAALDLADASLREEFARRDVLIDTTARFRWARGEVVGRVVTLDPLRGLSVEPAGGGAPVWLPAATTTVVAGDDAVGNRR